jgi:uracil-DNA glycosylase
MQVAGQLADYHGIKLMPTLHPAYLLRNPGTKSLLGRCQKSAQELGMPAA